MSLAPSPALPWPCAHLPSPRGCWHCYPRGLVAWLISPAYVPLPQIPFAPCRGSQRLGYPSGTTSASGSWSCPIPALNMGTLFSLAEAFKPSQDLPECLEAGRGGGTCLKHPHPQIPQYFALRGLDLPSPYSATGGREEEILRTHLLPSLSLLPAAFSLPPRPT